VIASIAMFVLGFRDDLHPIGPGKKLFVQILIAAGACWGGLELVVVKTPLQRRASATWPVGAHRNRRVASRCAQFD